MLIFLGFGQNHQVFIQFSVVLFEVLKAVVNIQY